eukprot:gnl/MRDRNA2_/MRDRNA2_126426_c0_seq1.p1 gnl/MRDRNA2_/MRDRNA2_126426_c0~~gnl/MRDRNA2_/MRDRNA2_126426_c0_seq1.p1  ORF type:complete len:591 (+),score=80.63 gnl/MRDRNA2_/MRDRNA2_126426_c0_seq1:67-1773(+)
MTSAMALDLQSPGHGSWEAFESTFIEDHVPRLLACTPGRLPRPEDLIGAPCAISTLSTSADGRVLCSGSHNGSIEFWSLPDLQSIGKIADAHGGMAVHEVSLAPDASFVVSCGADGAVRAWTLVGTEGQWQLAWSSRRHEAPCNESKNPHELQPWATNGWPNGHSRGHNKWVTDVLSIALVFCGTTESNKQGICASGGSDCSLRLYKLEDGATLFSSRAHRAAVTRVRGGAAGPRPLLATTSEDKALRLWSLELPLPSAGPECIWAVEEAHSAPVSTLALVAPRSQTTGGLLATGDSNGVLKIWHVRTGRCLREFDEGQGSHCLGVALALGVPAQGGNADAWAFSAGASGGLRGWRFSRAQGRAAPTPQKIVPAAPSPLQSSQQAASPAVSKKPNSMNFHRSLNTWESRPTFARGAGFRQNKRLSQTASAWLCVGAGQNQSMTSASAENDGPVQKGGSPSARLYQGNRKKPTVLPELAPALSSWRGHGAKVQRGFLGSVSEKHLIFELQSSAHPTTGSPMPICTLAIAHGMLISGSADGSLQVHAVDIEECEVEHWSQAEPQGGCRQM